ncbi:hypothetical protein TNIN_408461 [Trichonephila inaurata madagascariensis]|uniref:Uncharacterized protein n=1 Tax=Trichonephila inaurata madagascariensis TaxID=2747483 RepID=A0A8X7C637_9ARAC|nr:hypothetical protein TNIN_408461 [Trichonephila inaurata madagascariensis]
MKRIGRIEGDRSGLFTYDFKVVLSATVSCRRICQTFGDSAVNERMEGISFKNSGQEICPSVIKLEQNDQRPWTTKALQAVIEEHIS